MAKITAVSVGLLVLLLLPQDSCGQDYKTVKEYSLRSDFKLIGGSYLSGPYDLYRLDLIQVGAGVKRFTFHGAYGRVWFLKGDPITELRGNYFSGYSTRGFGSIYGWLPVGIHWYPFIASPSLSHDDIPMKYTALQFFAETQFLQWMAVKGEFVVPAGAISTLGMRAQLGLFAQGVEFELNYTIHHEPYEYVSEFYKKEEFNLTGVYVGINVNLGMGISGDTNNRQVRIKRPELGMSIRIEDENNDGKLEAGEKAYLRGVVVNDGDASASGVKLSLSSVDYPNLEFDLGESSRVEHKPQLSIGGISPGGKKEFEFLIETKNDLFEGDIRFWAEASSGSSRFSPRKYVDVPVVAYSLPQHPPMVEGSGYFEEPSDNRLLDAGETGYYIMTLVNSGSGEAYNLRAKATPDKQYNDITIGKIEPVHKLVPGDTVEMRIPFIADKKVASREVSYRIEVLEANGFDLYPSQLLTFNTEKFHPPELTLIDYAIEDESNNRMIERSERVTVSVRIQNEGAGAARDVKAVVNRGENVFFRPGTDSIFSLGDMPPGAYRDIEFKIFTNNRAENVPVSVNLEENGGSYNVMHDLNLPFDTRQKSPYQMVVRAEGTGTGFQPAPGLVSDIDRDIPYGAIPHPDAIAIIIGIQNYDELPAVDYALNDAQSVREYLLKTFRFKEDNILYYPDARLRDLELLFGKAGVYDNSKLHNFIKREVSDVFIYVCAHGGPGLNEPIPYILPKDYVPGKPEFTGYNCNNLYKSLAALPAKSMTLVIDACFSAQTGSVSKLGDRSPGFRPVDPYGKIAEKIPDCTIIASSPEYSGWYHDQSHSVLTYIFLKAIKGEADSDQNKQITISEIEKFLLDPNEGVPYISRRYTDYEQKPIIISPAQDKTLVHLK